LCESSDDDSPQSKLYTVKSKGKKKRNKKSSEGDVDEEEDLCAVPPHIMRIMQMTEEKKKIRKEAAAENKPDSTAILRNMMTMMKAKGVGLPDEERVEKETDMAKISNARDIFKQREAIEQDGEEAPKPRAEKQKRVDVCVGFLNDNKNKAEEMRQARLREMAAMRAAREEAMEEEERANRSRHDGDDIKRQRELEIDMMRQARQEALEEEERRMAMERSQPARAVSPSLVAAKNVNVNRDFLDDGERKVEQLRFERERELQEMRRMREQEMEMEEMQEQRESRSEASRELEAFRASRGGGDVRQRFVPREEGGGGGRPDQLTKAPRRGKSDNWMVNSSQDKAEAARIARERELESLMVARGQAIEEEEAERAEEEMMRRMDAERKAKEMAVLVADLQRMRSETARNAEEEERMTRYQEEMLTRVMELHQIAKGGMLV